MSNASVVNPQVVDVTTPGNVLCQHDKTARAHSFVEYFLINLELARAPKITKSTIEDF